MKSGEYFAMVPEEVLQSDAYVAQPDWAKVVLLALAARYKGFNNGDLSLTFSDAKRLGVTAQWKLYAALKLLQLAGLVICTRRGHLTNGTKLCSLYAVTWRGINTTNTKLDVGVSTSPLPCHAWVKWKIPDDWADMIKKVRNANHGRAKNPVSTTMGKGSLNHDGSDDANIAQPWWGKDVPFIAPSMVDTSKNLGGGTPAEHRPTRKWTATNKNCERGA